MNFDYLPLAHQKAIRTHELRSNPAFMALTDTVAKLEARIAALERRSTPMDFPAIDESLIDQPKEQK